MYHILSPSLSRSLTNFPPPRFAPPLGTPPPHHAESLAGPRGDVYYWELNQVHVVLQAPPTTWGGGV
jgi:hypothetical protein